MNKEKQYIERVLHGDVNAFSHLVDLHKNLVYTIALRMLKNTEDAEELAQDTFIKAYNSLKEFKFESKFSTWLYRITYNGAISKLRKKEVQYIDSGNNNLYEQEVESNYNAISELNRNEQKKYISEAIEQLKEDDAFLITMYYLNESSINEISEITDFSISNLKVKLHRARKKFYDALTMILKEEVRTIL